MSRYFMWFDSSKARRELGYTPGPARSALASAVRWFIENGYVKAKRRERISLEDAACC
jgi:dihydroflavonol-4-reductase